MADILDSLVITLDDADDSTDVDVNIDYDEELNTYDNGEATTTFYKGEDIFLLVQLEPGYSISGIKKTSGGVANLGLVTRTETVTDHFFPDGDEQSLTWYPSTNVIIDTDHEQDGTQVLTVTDKKITCNNPPTVLDYHYQYQAYSVRVSHPSGMNIDDDETFPIGIVIEVTK